ncbi:MAG TPA: prephenate dehydratase [Ideonella sp.]|uniref:prephenate dehydratase n=1 Tax=Ideonella sp. TaxID=1929293 RepID=UPI002BADD02D|nr:prephenate dehydratase [Ideonella sp.]HSI47895.1 prephenate dehydratase [Ideonella sp.]
MAEPTSGNPAATPAVPAPELLALREQIDSLDQDLLALLNRRAGLALAVGELKKKEGSVVFRPEREAQVIDGLKASNPGPLKTDSVAPIWREIMSACRALETPTRVAYLGPAGTFSEEAALGYFGSSIVRVPCTSIDDVFRTTAAGAADFGVVPVENSTEGVVARSLDIFLTTPLFIIGETSLFVRHNLLRKENSLEGIEVVCAHPQALAQCHGWLSSHLPNVERQPMASNAEAARQAALNPRLAAIASVRAGSEYGLHLVSPAIQDDTHNRTRFAIVTDPHRHPAPKASGHDCTSLVVSVVNRPGAMYDILKPLKAHDVSMTRFESRPARSGQWEYYFYIDLQGHPDELHVHTAMQELRQACAYFKVLGTYPLDVH